jgi:hypothetical protein
MFFSFSKDASSGSSIFCLPNLKAICSTTSNP